MKKILLILVSIVLCACSNVVSLANELDKVFVSDYKSLNRANNYAKYIEYYSPSDVNEDGADDFSYTFEIDNCKIIMNINIASILNKNDYSMTSLNDDGFFDNEKLVYEHSDCYTNINNEKIDFFIKIYKYDQQCLAYLASSEVILYGYCPIGNEALLASKMLQIAAGANVNSSEVIKDFSNKDVIDYQRKTVNLFESIYPVDGRVEDMIVGYEAEVPEE